MSTLGCPRCIPTRLLERCSTPTQLLPTISQHMLKRQTVAITSRYNLRVAIASVEAAGCQAVDDALQRGALRSTLQFCRDLDRVMGMWQRKWQLACCSCVLPAGSFADGNAQTGCHGTKSFNSDQRILLRKQW